MGKQILVAPSSELGWVAVVRALERLPYVRSVVSASDLKQAAELARRSRPDAVVIAAPAEGDRGVFAISRLRRHLPDSCPVAIIGRSLDQGPVPTLYRLNVRGFFLWDELTPELLAPSLAAFVGGMTVASPSLGNVIPAPDPSAVPQPSEPLTEREQLVLRDLSEGLGEQQIAKAQHLSVRSVRRAIASIKGKLGASTMFLLGRASTQVVVDFPQNVAMPRTARR
jgi:DNA-binding NarL/FixJ family response regulator